MLNDIAAATVAVATIAGLLGFLAMIIAVDRKPAKPVPAPQPLCHALRGLGETYTVVWYSAAPIGQRRKLTARRNVTFNELLAIRRRARARGYVCI